MSLGLDAMAYMLTPEQENRAVEVMLDYLAAPPSTDGRSPTDEEAELDRNRVTLIENELKPFVESYLAGATPLTEFKSRTDGINKRHPYWGFRGIKGQMFFNMLVNVANDLGECDQEIKAAIALPTSEDIAKSRIKTFQSFVRRIGDESVEAGGSKMGRPKPGSIPFFVSYFWQIQDRTLWPVYYTNAVNTLIDLNLWQPSENIAEDYVEFKRLHEALAKLFSERAGRPFGLYDVEHVFWFKGGNPYDEARQAAPVDSSTLGETRTSVVEETTSFSRLPDSFVPPIVAILPRLAKNEPGLADAAQQSGTKLPKAFEKSVHAAFTILGYDAKLLGQGLGRVPDGSAVDHDNLYAIIWDAKIRENGYSMGTDDRAIREYVSRQSKDLKRKQALRNIYYVIVSSGFQDGFDDLIRSLKMETDTNEVCLLEASALVAMVDAKLRNPAQVSLGPDGLQRLFCDSGIIRADDILQILS